MSILSEIGDFFQKLWDKISSFLSKLSDQIKEYLPLIIMAVVVLWPVIGVWLQGVLPAVWGSWLASSVAWVAGLETMEVAALALGASFLIAPDETTEYIGDTSEAIGDSATEVIGNIGSGVVNGTTDMLFNLNTSSLALLGLAGYAAYVYFTDDDHEDIENLDDNELSTYNIDEEISDNRSGDLETDLDDYAGEGLFVGVDDYDLNYNGGGTL
jgi:phage-related protein